MEVSCYFRYISVEDGLITKTRKVAIPSKGDDSTTFNVNNEIAAGITITCGLEPGTGILLLGSETTY